MSTIPKGARDFLATGPFAHIVTLNPDGTPHVSLAWAGVDDDGGIVWSSFSDQRKFDNLRRDPRGSRCRSRRTRVAVSRSTRTS